MRDADAQFQRYEASLHEINTAIVEFVRGIGPIKVFATDDKGYQRFHNRSREFARFYLDWVQSTVRAPALLLVLTSRGFALAVSGLGATLLIVYGGLDPIALIPALLLSANIAGPVE
ncbi:ABC transporter ATP-binding protein [Micromonospora craniellae]|uniref:ABC transporter ATP-binding protein n=2 Tax=Micromonospora craniellae TaxID=2294034 RepID=A0A372G0N8_9ACTN|nr:ABC transporter ATP-binding protein [Micromonospora craniellae]